MQTSLMSDTLSENSDTQGIALVAGLRSARTALGWSQARLAKAAGVAKVTVARMEAGMMSPRLSTITALQAVMEREGVRLTLNSPPGGFSLTVDGDALRRSSMATPFRPARPAGPAQDISSDT